jgi:hypothetical protein
MGWICHATNTKKEPCVLIMFTYDEKTARVHMRDGAVFVAAYNLTDSPKTQKIIIYDIEKMVCVYEDGTPLSDASMHFALAVTTATMGIGVAAIGMAVSYPFLSATMLDSLNGVVCDMWQAASYVKENVETGVVGGFVGSDLTRTIRSSSVWKRIAHGIGYVSIPDMGDVFNTVSTADRLVGTETGCVHDIGVLMSKLQNMTTSEGGMIASVSATGTHTSDLMEYVQSEIGMTVVLDKIKTAVSADLSHDVSDADRLHDISMRLMGVVDASENVTISPTITTFKEYVDTVYNDTDVDAICRIFGQVVGREIGKEIIFKCSDLLRLYNVSTVLDTCKVQYGKEQQKLDNDWTKDVYDKMDKERQSAVAVEIADASKSNDRRVLWQKAFTTLVNAAVKTVTSETSCVGQKGRKIINKTWDAIDIDVTPSLKQAVKLVANLVRILHPVEPVVITQHGMHVTPGMQDICGNVDRHMENFARASALSFDECMRREVLAIHTDTIHEAMRFGTLEKIKLSMNIMVSVIPATTIGRYLHHKQCMMRAYYEYRSAWGACRYTTIADKTKSMTTATKNAAAKAKNTVINGFRRMAGYKATTTMFKDCCTTTL